MGPETPIVTPRPGFNRAMLANSTETSAFAAIPVQITEPATVEGTTAVFDAGSNHTMIWPFVLGADNTTFKMHLTSWRRHLGSVLVVISGASKASPVSITATAHGLSTGDVVLIASVLGMVELNGLQHKITVTGANTFTIPVDSTGFTTYSSGGTATKEAATSWWNSFIGTWDVIGGATGCVGVAGGPLLTTERFCDSIVAEGTNNGTIEVQTYSPLTDSHGDIPGYILIDQLGAPKIQANFDKGTATSMNLMVASF